MIDVPDRIRDYLVAQTSVTALTSTRIWAEMTEPVAGYKPSDGAAIAFTIAGGVNDYGGVTANPRVQFKCYGATRFDANTLYRTLYSVLRRGSGDGIKSSLIETLGQTLAEPDTGWPFVLVFASFWIKAE